MGWKECARRGFLERREGERLHFRQRGNGGRRAGIEPTPRCLPNALVGKLDEPPAGEAPEGTALVEAELVANGAEGYGIRRDGQEGEDTGGRGMEPVFRERASALAGEARDAELPKPFRLARAGTLDEPPANERRDGSSDASPPHGLRDRRGAHGPVQNAEHFRGEAPRMVSASRLRPLVARPFRSGRLRGQHRANDEPGRGEIVVRKKSGELELAFGEHGLVVEERRQREHRRPGRQGRRLGNELGDAADEHRGSEAYPDPRSRAYPQEPLGNSVVKRARNGNGESDRGEAGEDVTHRGGGG